MESGSDGLMFYGSVAREMDIRGEESVGDGVVDQEGKTSPTRARGRPVAADEGVGREGVGLGGGRELGLLNCGDEDGVAVEERGEFGGAVLKTVTVELD